MSFIQRDSFITGSATMDAGLYLLGALSVGLATACAYSGESSSRITQIAASTLALGIAITAAILSRKRRTDNAKLSVNEQVKRLCSPTDAKIEAAWKRIQALTWYPDLLRKVQFPPVGADQEKWNWVRSSGSATHEEVRAFLREELKEGDCDGITNAVLHNLVANPYASELQVLSPIDLEEVVYYQMLSFLSRRVINSGRDLSSLANKMIVSFEAAKPEIWKTKRTDYERMRISEKIEDYENYILKILKDKPSSKSIILGKIFLPKHVMGFELFPNGESRIFQNGHPFYGKTIQTFTVSLVVLSNELTEQKNNRMMRISACFV